MNRLVSSIRGRYAGNRSDILRFSFFFCFVFHFSRALGYYARAGSLSRL